MDDSTSLTLCRREPGELNRSELEGGLVWVLKTCHEIEGLSDSPTPML